MWAKLRTWLNGRKTVYIARIYTLAGLLLLVKDTADAHGFDVSPYLPSWLGPASPHYALFCLATGVLFEGMRWITRNPVTYLQGTTDKYGNPL
jgi:hypothetical protein